MHFYSLPSAGGIGALRLEEGPKPSPGPGEVLVRIRAASLNYRDLLIANGAYGPGLRLPLIPLSDGAGEVVARGEGANRFQEGDRVAGCFLQDWIAGGYREEYGGSALGGAIDGVLAEYKSFPEGAVTRVPGHLSWEEAACLPCAAVTAWNALFVAAGIRPGDTVLVLGSGGVSVFALQFARLAGASVIATSSRNDRLERLGELGAGRLINYRETPEWGRTVREMTAGRGVDVVVEVGGAGTLEQSLRAVRSGGTVSLIGVLGGPGEFNVTRVLMNSIRVQGIYVGSREMFEQMNRAIESEHLRPVVDRVFPFEEAPAAYRHLESAAHLGKVVIQTG